MHMPLTRSDLFGYAGASHEPQGRVLTSEEDYGAHGFGALNSASLLEEEAYGALNSPSLFAEEGYGALNSASLLEEEAYGALNSPSLFAEEEYGEEDDEDEDSYGGSWRYGASDDDDDDDDDLDLYEDEDLEEGFGADEADSAEAELDAFDAELGEEVFGAWYGFDGGSLAVPPGTEAARDAVASAVTPTAVMMPSMMPSMMQYAAEKFINSTERWFVQGDDEELASYVLLGLQDAGVPWNQMSRQQKETLVYNAVVSSAIPGIEYAWDEPFRQAWASSDGFTSTAMNMAKASPSAMWAFLVTDVPNAMVTAMGEIPGLSTVTEYLAENPDEFVNSVAIRYYFLGLVGVPVYSWLVQSIDANASGAMASAWQTMHESHAGPTSMDLGTLLPQMPVPASHVGPTSISTSMDLGTLPQVPVLAPPQVIPETSTGLPAPQTILAMGYAAMAGGAVLGIFK
jgi:hypothetical protein